jgi:hypothetical protein
MVWQRLEEESISYLTNLNYADINVKNSIVAEGI